MVTSYPTPPTSRITEVACFDKSVPDKCAIICLGKLSLEMLPHYRVRIFQWQMKARAQGLKYQVQLGRHCDEVCITSRHAALPPHRVERLRLSSNPY